MKLIYLPSVILTFLLFSCSSSNGAKIFQFFPMSSVSHYTLGLGLAKGLAAKGHEITFVTPINATKNYKNINHIYLDGMEEIVNGNV